MSRLQVKLSKVRDWYSLPSASGSCYHCLQKHAKYSFKFRLSCLWLCVGGTGIIKELLVTLSASISSMGWVNSLVRLSIAPSSFLHCGTRCSYAVSKVQQNLSLTNTCLYFRSPRKDICKSGGKPAGVGDLNLSAVTRADYLFLM